MKRVIFSRQAYGDLQRLEEWLAERAPEAAQRIGPLLAGALTSLEEHAERGRRGPRSDLRELVVPFGVAAYLIQYRVEGTEVYVARIRHSREDRR